MTYFVTFNDSGVEEKSLSSALSSAKKFSMRYGQAEIIKEEQQRVGNHFIPTRTLKIVFKDGKKASEETICERFDHETLEYTSVL